MLSVSTNCRVLYVFFFFLFVCLIFFFSPAMLIIAGYCTLCWSEWLRPTCTCSPSGSSAAPSSIHTWSFSSKKTKISRRRRSPRPLVMSIGSSDSCYCLINSSHCSVTRRCNRVRILAEEVIFLLLLFLIMLQKF